MGEWHNEPLDLPRLGPRTTDRWPCMFFLSLCPPSAAGHLRAGRRHWDTSAPVFPPASVKETDIPCRTTIPLSHLREATINSPIASNILSR